MPMQEDPKPAKPAPKAETPPDDSNELKLE